ncbi:YibE/F family protein [Magnetococcus marinus MC-1]|uniref:YibE/F family protein n=2 Tax=Magnetococcus TaxID=162171 RepID=A0LA07_MAGMM|nr:YibE/F family protein [Magnetococcus marinus MC-1]
MYRSVEWGMMQRLFWLCMVLAWGWPAEAKADLFSEGRYQAAVVVEIASTGKLPERQVQSWHVKALLQDEGVPTGFELFADPATPELMPQTLNVGDSIILSCNGEQCSYFDQDRRHGWWLIGVLFLVVVALVCGIHGAFALFAMGFSLATIFVFMTPLLLQGWNPFWLCLGTAILLVVVLIVVGHGVTMRSAIAAQGAVLALLTAALFAWVTVWILGLDGAGSEVGLYSNFGVLKNLDMRGLFLGAILLGCIGVLDDVTWAQAAVVEDMALNHPRMGTIELYQASLLAGREYLVGMINTLALAYVGAGLPLLILALYDQSLPLWVSLNSQVVQEVLVRTLSGGFALTLALPITTWLAARKYAQQPRLGRTKPLRGNP